MLRPLMAAALVVGASVISPTALARNAAAPQQAAGPVHANHSPPALAKAIDAYVAPYLAFHAFSGVILVAAGDTILVNRPYGMANYEFSVSNTVDTRFRIASISKRLTNVLLTHLAEEKKLSPADPLSKYFPAFPKADRITIKQLADHRSGIRDPEKLRRIISANYTPAAVVDILAKEPLGSEPGETYSYTTANYAVLAAIIEQVTGRSFADNMREDVYVPAGATDSGEIDSTTVIPRLAAGYMPDPFSDGVSVCGPEDASWKVGGGSSFTTARDLLRIVRALYAGKLMSASPFDVLPHRTMFGKRSFESSGAYPGANANLTYFPDDQVTVVVLSNNYAPVTGPIARDVAAMYFGQPYAIPRIPTPGRLSPVDPRVLGQWALEGYATFTVVERMGRPVIVWDLARQEAMIPVGRDEYFAPLDFARIVFTFGDTAQAVWTAPWTDHPLKVTRPQE